jgi:hypothetical protein
VANAQLATVGLRGRPEAAALIAQGNGVMAATVTVPPPGPVVPPVL